MFTRTALFAAKTPSAALVPFRYGPALDGPSRPAGKGRLRSRRNRPAIELMEERTLLSGRIIPTGLVPTYQEVKVESGRPELVLMPMQNTVVEGTMGPSRSKITVKVDLEQGEILSVDGSVTGDVHGVPTTFPFTLTINGPTGKVASEQSGVIDLTVPTTGRYTVTISCPHLKQKASYVMYLRPIELLAGPADPSADAANAALVSFNDGGLYAWLNGKKTELTFSGPTGIGFQVCGNWTESTTGKSSSGYISTYTDSGNISLTLFGQTLSLPLPSGVDLVVKTNADGADGLFGQVDSESLQLGHTDLPMSLDGSSLPSLLGPLSNIVGQSVLSVGSNIGTQLSEISVGIELGSNQNVQATGVPVDPAIPYLYFSLTTGVSLNVPGATISSNDSYNGGVVIDPADSMVGIDIGGLPDVPNVGLAVSQYATIPYTPSQTPDEWKQGTLYGDVYLTGQLDLSAITDDVVPMTVSGSITADLDPQNKGLTNAIEQDFNNLIHRQSIDLAGMSVGINGEADLTLSATSAFTISIPAFEASVIYDGSNQTIYVHGGEVNPFANVPVLASLFGTNAEPSFDGTVSSNGDFNFDVSNIPIAGIPELTATVDISNTRIHLKGQLDLGPLTVSVKGDIQTNGTFTLDGVASFDIPQSGVSFGSVSFSGSFDGSVAVEVSSTGSIYYSLDVETNGSASLGGQSLSVSESASTYGTTTVSDLVDDLNWLSDIPAELINIYASELASEGNALAKDIENGLTGFLNDLESAGDWLKDQF